MADNFEKIFKMFHTLRHYRKSQLGWYLYYRVRKLLPVSWWFSCKVPSGITIDAEKKEKLRSFAKIWAETSYWNQSEVDRIINGEVEYAGEKYPLSRFLMGVEDGISPLARYGLHSFEFLWKLCLFYLSSGNEDIERLAKNCVLEWINSNPPGKPISWDPYPTSYRIRYILSACAIWNWNESQILESVFLQIRYLLKSLEFHLLGNHLIQNLCGLLVGAELFSLEIKDKVLEMLEKELREQILEDGGHYERVPMYHFHVLIDLLWLTAVLEPVPEFLENAIERMLRFAKDITLSDGNYPLFGDSVYYHLPSWNEVSYVAGKLTNIKIKDNGSEANLVKLADSGYYLFRYGSKGERNIELVVRAGKPGPDYQLAHAHCDQLSYEMLIEGKRFIVDSGINGYAGSLYRSFQRSTRAHNTVWIEGVEQLEGWGVFRVARRGRCLVEEARFEDDTFKFIATYHFYTGEKHRRIIEFNYPYMKVSDEVFCLPKSYSVFNFIHFHPNVDVEAQDSCIIATGYGIRVKLLVYGNTCVSLVKGVKDLSQGWYSERFGLSVPNSVVIMEKQNNERSKYLILKYQQKIE